MATKKKPSSASAVILDVETDVFIDAEDFIRMTAPDVCAVLDNVLLVFAKSIPEDSRAKCEIAESGETYPADDSEAAKLKFLTRFARERLDMIALREYCLWLNGRLPFITPRELLVWRLRQFVEFIWAFQLPADEDLALIFNSTKVRAAHIASDFTARFRKALLFPIALRRLYRILRGLDPVYGIEREEYEHQRADGTVFRVPSRRYLQDANSLIEEFRMREVGIFRSAALVGDTEDNLWVHDRVVEMVKDDEIRNELFRMYRVPSEAGYEG